MVEWAVVVPLDIQEKIKQLNPTPKAEVKKQLIELSKYCAKLNKDKTAFCLRFANKIAVGTYLKIHVDNETHSFRITDVGPNLK